MHKIGVKDVFVTGGSGKVGRSLLPELVSAGYKVRALKFDEAIDCEGVETFDGDLRDPGLAPRALEDMDAVIHLANCKESRELFLDTNIRGAFHLLDEAMRCNHIKQFIQAGSDARAGIFYHPRPYPIDENFPHSAYPGYYALSKVLEEVMCEQYRIQHGVPITVLRFSWVHEADDFLCHITLKEPGFGVPVWRELAKTAEQRSYFEQGLDAVAKLVHPGGRPGIRHIVGIKDVIQGVMLSLDNPGALGQAFAIAGPSAFSYDAAAEYAAKKLGLPVVEFECGNFYDFSHNISKPRSVLGYDPQYDIYKIIDEGVAFRKAGGVRHPLKYIG